MNQNSPKSSLTLLKVKNHLAAAPSVSPSFAVTIKNRSGSDVKVADPQITRALLAIMNMAAVNGGAACHWGGPAGLAELMAAAHALCFAREDWYNHFHFVNDVGHSENGIYALRANLHFDKMSLEDLLSFRSISSPLTGHGEAHVNPRGVLISNGPLGSGLPQAQGLAIADCMAGKRRTTLCVLSDGAAMEGEAKEAFSTIAGLARQKKMNPFVLIFSFNDTKLSGRISSGAYTMGETEGALLALGWNVIKLDDGHDLEQAYQSLEWAIEEANRNPSRPVCLFAKTIKGKGIKETEAMPSGGHGYPLKAYDPKLREWIQELLGDKVPSAIENLMEKVLQKPAQATATTAVGTVRAPELFTGVAKEKIQQGIARALSCAKKAGSPIFSISADLQSSTGLAPFHKEFPESALDVGVAESNMISTAIGMSKVGFIPVVDTFAQFAVTKGNLPLIMNNLSMGQMIGIFSHTGFQDAADGASHQATTYLSTVANIPGVTAICCSSSSQAEQLLLLAIEVMEKAVVNDRMGQAFLFFIGREDFPQRYDEKITYEWGKPQIYGDQGENDLMIVASGSIVLQALWAQHELKSAGIKAVVVDNPFVNRIDRAGMSELLKRSHGRLLTLEDHQVKGGMGALLVQELVGTGLIQKSAFCGIKGHFGRSAYSALELYRQAGLDWQSVVESAKTLLK